jgi:ABC-2 type transport system permease protein
MSFAPATMPWFAANELRLAWRDFAAMATGGRRTRAIVLVLVLLGVAVVMHLLAHSMVAPWVAAGVGPDKATLVLLTGSGLLFWTVMLSQALESVTRAYYARSDLDLILSSPASSRRLFFVRTGATGFATLLLSMLIASPVVNALILTDGPRWFAAYGALAALSALSTAIAVVVTLGLFAVVGPRRTRLIAQIVAAVVGAGFVIGIQAAAILAYGNMSRFDILQSETLITAAPETSSWVWLPARAAMGDLVALVIVALIGSGAFAAVVGLAASSFGRHALAAGSISRAQAGRSKTAAFRAATQKQALRRKEWKLLARDPWLLSQTLMQILYLVPPALLLWINFGEGAGVFIVVVPVLVMASGQLAGGLAWLAISGEDAHDLVVSAPLSPSLVLRAKIEAVVVVLAMIMLPILALMTLSSPTMAAITALCAALAGGSATAIQLWFRQPMRRSMFRRRQVASRMATISEAFVSIMWAGVAALLVANSWLSLMAVLPAVLAAAILLAAWALSPKGRAA